MRLSPHQKYSLILLRLLLCHRWDMNVTFENHFHIPALSDRAYLYGVDNFLQEHFCKGL